MAYLLTLESPFKLVMDAIIAIWLDEGSADTTDTFAMVDSIANLELGKNFHTISSTETEWFGQTQRAIDADDERLLYIYGLVNPSADVIISFNVKIFDAKLSDSGTYDTSLGLMLEVGDDFLDFTEVAQAAYTLTQLSSITGRPSTYQFDFTTHDSIAAGEDLMFKVVLPVSNFYLGDPSVKDFTDTARGDVKCRVSQDGTWLDDGGNEEFEVVADTGTTGTQQTVILSCLMGPSLLEANTGSVFIIEMLNFKNPQTTKPIPYDVALTNIYRIGLLMSPDDTRCSPGWCTTTGYDERCWT